MKLFFSYGHDKHKDVVHDLAHKIEELTNDITVWIDTYKIPRDSHWRGEITKGINESKSVIAFLSKHSADEESVCRDELSIAIASKHGMIHTILLESKESFTPPAIVTEYQWGDLSNYPEIRAQGREAYSRFIAEEAAKIIDLVTSDDIKKYNSEVTYLREKLTITDIDDLTKFDAMIRNELAGREWLFKRINEWCKDANGSQIMMLYGKPGAGKSMIAAHLQLRCPYVAAAFPCDCRTAVFSETGSIIRHIAYRLALRLPDFRESLVREFNDPQTFTGDEDMLFRRLIANPLSKLAIDGKRSVQLIIIDALDEMKSGSLASFIQNYAPMMKQYVRFLITARKEAAIVGRFGTNHSIDLDEETEMNSADLREYFEKRLGGILPETGEKAGFIDRLVTASDGVFAYAECVCNNIEDDIDANRFEMRDYKLPEGLAGLYFDTFERRFGDSEAEETKEKYLRGWFEPLAMIIASPEPLPTETLKKLMGWSKRELLDFRRPLSTMITEISGCFQVFHRSLAEWLDTTDSCFAAPAEDGKKTLAKRCYDVFCDGVEEMDPFMLLYTTQLLRECRMKREYEKVVDNGEFLFKLDHFAGRLHYYLQEYNKAILYYMELKKIWQDKVSKSPEKIDYNFEYAFMLINIAKLYETQKKFNNAIQYYMKASEKYSLLAEYYPEEPNQINTYASLLISIAGIYSKQNLLSEAKQFYTKAKDILKKLIEQNPDNPDYINNYSGSISELGRINIIEGNKYDALLLFVEDLDISRFLSNKYPDNSIFLFNNSKSLEAIAQLFESQDMLDEAMEYYRESLSIIEKLLEDEPEDADYQVMNSSLLHDIGNVFFIKGMFDEALQRFYTCLEISERLINKFPENPEYLLRFGISLANIAEVYSAKNNITEAEKNCIKSLTIFKGLAEKYPESLEYIGYLAGTYFMVFLITEDETYIEKALEIAKQHPDLPACAMILRSIKRGDDENG